MGELSCAKFTPTVPLASLVVNCRFGTLWCSGLLLIDLNFQDVRRYCYFTQMARRVLPQRVISPPLVCQLQGQEMQGVISKGVGRARFFICPFPLDLFLAMQTVHLLHFIVYTFVKLQPIAVSSSCCMLQHGSATPVFAAQMTTDPQV